MIIRGPRYVQGCPLLCNGPLFAEKASPVKVLVFSEEIIIRDPEELQVDQVSV